MLSPKHWLHTCKKTCEGYWQKICLIILKFKKRSGTGVIFNDKL